MIGPTLRLALLTPLVLLAACSSPIPSHLTRLWPGDTTGEPFLGLSTQDGILILVDTDFQVGDVFEIHFPVGNSSVRDWGTIIRMNDELAVVAPQTARVSEGRIATRLPEDTETLYLALRDEEDAPIMEEVEPWLEGRYGNYITVPGRSPEAIAREHAGAGLYVHRGERWVIVGMLAGITAEVQGESDAGVGFIGLLEMSRILPDLEDFFAHDVKPLRPDFEFGVPLQPGDVELDDGKEDADAGGLR